MLNTIIVSPIRLKPVLKVNLKKKMNQSWFKLTEWKVRTWPLNLDSGLSPPSPLNLHPGISIWALASQSGPWPLNLGPDLCTWTLDTLNLDPGWTLSLDPGLSISTLASQLPP
jgi:hypothetical protein